MNPSDLSLLSTFVRSVAKLKLTGHQLTLLTTVARNPGVHLNKVSELSGIHYSKDSYHPLIRKGYLKTKPSGHMRTSFSPDKIPITGLHITKEGEAVLESLIESIKKGVSTITKQP